MKIFYDHKIFCKQEIGGPSKYFVQLNNHLNKTNVNAKIFAGFHLNKYLKNYKLKNSIGFEKNFFFSKYFVNTKIVSKINSFNEIINLNFLKSFNPDVIYSTYYDGSFYTKNKPLVITVFDLIHEIFYKSYGYQNPYYPKKNAIDRANHIICISKSTTDDLMRFYNVDTNKISIIHLGTEKKLKPNSGAPIKYPYILYIGNRHLYKNFEVFLKSLSTEPKILKNFKIVLFGGKKNFDKNELNLLELYKIDLKNFLFFEGSDDLLNSFYQNARLLIYPSKYEGFGLPILEGFANNCPVICSNISVFKEVAGNAAVYFDPNKHDSLSYTLTKVLFSDLVRQDLINKGKKRIELFNWNKCAQETKEVYKKLI